MTVTVEVLSRQHLIHIWITSRPKEIVNSSPFSINSIISERVPDNGAHRPQIREITPQPIKSRYMSPLELTCPRSPHMFSWIVQIEEGRVHDLLGTRCDPYVNKMLSGQDFDCHCHSNLTRAIFPYGLQESDVHDVLNIFQSTGLNSSDQYFMKTCPAVAGSYFEFFAEIDLLCALSTCPGGDLSKPMWGPDIPPGEDPSLECCRPLKVEVLRLKDNDGLLKGWQSPRSAREVYKGDHGFKSGEWVS